MFSSLNDKVKTFLPNIDNDINSCFNIQEIKQN